MNRLTLLAAAWCSAVLLYVAHGVMDSCPSWGDCWQRDAACEGKPRAWSACRVEARRCFERCARCGGKGC